MRNTVTIHKMNPEIKLQIEYTEFIKIEHQKQKLF